jgi:septum formation protein
LFYVSLFFNFSEMESKHVSRQITPPLKIAITPRIDDDKLTPRGDAPSSPTDHLLSPVSRMILRKRSSKTLIRREFHLSAEIPKRICPLPITCSLILGSSSKSRREILETMHWQFTVMSPDIDEKSFRSENFLELPEIIAKAKASAIFSRLQQHQFPTEQIHDDHKSHLCEIAHPKTVRSNPKDLVILTCDTVALFHGALREKPTSEEECVNFLTSYNKDCVSTISAVCATHFPSGRQHTEVDISTVHWGDLSDEVIATIVRRGAVMNAAGGFMIDDPDLFAAVRSVDGTIDSVMGLPVDASVRVIAAVLGEEEEDDTTIQAEAKV